MNSAEKEAVLHCLKSMIDEEVCEECPLYGTTGTDHCEKDCVRLAINALSLITPTQKMGRWIMHIDDLFPSESTMECSECGEHQPITIDDNYCPNCGAKMEVEE